MMLDRFDTHDLERTPPQTEDSAERGFVPHRKDTHEPVTYPDLGHAEELDQQDAGDIADEGSGHRG